jgi:hypothetical protein
MSETDTSQGYKDVIKHEDGFIAVGTNGRIDRISKSGEIQKLQDFPEIGLNCVLTNNNQIIVAGDHGKMLISYDHREFVKTDCGTKNTINSMTLFNNTVIAGANEGEILLGIDNTKFKSIQLNLKGDVVSVSANASYCYGVTNAGEIIHTTDGINWNIFDFNQEYKGYYQPCYFTSILVTDQVIAVAGIKDNGLPVFMISNMGKVWSERVLTYNDGQGMQNYLTDSPNDIFYDTLYQQFYLVCDNGKLMTLPNCSHCNKLEDLSAYNLSGISGNSETLMIVGDRYYIKPISQGWV